jgi:hypothetical protein
VFEWEEAPKRFESVGVSKYTIKRVASYAAQKLLKLWQHKVGTV